MTRHVLSLADLSASEVATVLDLAEAPPDGDLLRHQGVALVFEHPSARTRNACELAAVQLGGHPVTIRGEEIGIDKRETAEDVALTLACYHALIGVRVARHATLERMAAALGAAGSRVPVVNLLSDREHPTQALADLLTIRQRLGSLAGRTLAYVGDANNVFRSLVAAGARTQMRCRLAAPPGYGFDQADLEWAEGLGADLTLSASPEEAAAGADVLYTDVWVSMGQEEEQWARRRAFAGYSIDMALVSLASPEAIVLHCLPAHRGEEISAAALDGPCSAVWQQAANRMHAARGLFSFLLGATAPSTTAAGEHR